MFSAAQPAVGSQAVEDEPPARIVVLPGHGVGPEVIDVAVDVLRSVADQHGIAIDLEERLVGGAVVDSEGSAISQQTL